MFTGQTNQTFIVVSFWERLVCMCLHVDVCMCEREEGSDHAATIKLSLLQKVPVSEIVLFLECVC